MKKKIVEYRIKNRYLVYFILAGFLMGAFFGVFSHDAVALSVTKTEFFDTYSNGGQVAKSHGSFFDSYNNLKLQNRFNVSTAQKLSGTASFLINFNTPLRSYWNISSTGEYFNNFSFSIKPTFANGDGLNMYFNNTVHKSFLMLHLSTTVSNFELSYFNGVSWSSILTTTDSNWVTIDVTRITDNSINISIYQYSTHVRLGSVLIGTLSYLTNFSHIQFFGFSGAGQNIYFDNIYYTSSSGGASSDNCGYDMSGHQSNSIERADSTIFSSDKYIESEYNVPLSTSIFGVSLAVTGVQHTYTPDLGNYSLKINNYDLGAPDCFSKTGETLYDDIYSLFWEMTLTFSNEPLIMEFYHSEKITGTSYYWDLYGAFKPYFFEKTLEHSSIALYDGSYNGVNKHGFYSVINFYYDTVLFENETSPYSDLVTCPKTTYSTFDTIPISFFVSDFTYSNSIQLWRNGTQKTDAIQGFPYSVLTGDFFGELSYTPLLSGRYQFRIVRKGLIKSTFNVTVTNPADMSFILAVYPNPCEFNTKVFIHFRFYPSDGAEGFIGVSEFPDTSGFSSFDESLLLSANTTGNKSFFPQTNMYVSLWKKSGNSSFVRIAIKYLKMYSLFDNTINVLYKSIQLSDAVPSVSQHIYGTHVVQGFKTFIRMNNKLLQYVTDTPFYNMYVDITTAGAKNVELCMETANGSIVLCSVNFTVSSPDAGGGAGADVFPAEMKLLFGICCILVAVSCPLMISVKYHVAVPTFVYVVFMAFGIGIGTVLGFLELWLVFLFVVALVAGAVFTIFGHGGQGGGGGDSGVSRKGGILSRRGGKDYATTSKKADYGVSPKGSPGYLKGPGRRGY